MGSTVEQDRSHLAEQVEYAGERGRFADETPFKEQYSTSWQESWDTHFLLKKLNKFQEYTNINQNYWDQKLGVVERLPVFDDGENESLEDDVHSFVDKTSHLTTAVFEGGGVEMNILLQPYIFTPTTP